LPLPEGYQNLPLNRKNKAASLTVKRGCVFEGFDHDDQTHLSPGDTFAVDASNYFRDANVDLIGRDRLEEDISAANCTCPGPDYEAIAVSTKMSSFGVYQEKTFQLILESH